MDVIFQRVHRWDTSIFVWLHITRKCPYRAYVRWLSRSGDGYLYALIALAVWYCEPVQGTFFARACAVAYTLEVFLYLVLKNTIKRNRPALHIKDYRPWIVPSDQFSFPSGHTAAAFVIAGLVALFYPSYAGIFYLWACLIGLSRVLLGVHYPSDVVAGALFGTGCALIGAGIAS